MTNNGMGLGWGGEHMTHHCMSLGWGRWTHDTSLYGSRLRRWTHDTSLCAQKTMNSFEVNKSITDLCSNYQYICLAHILNFSFHFKTIIMYVISYVPVSVNPVAIKQNTYVLIFDINKHHTP